MLLEQRLMTKNETFKKNILLVPQGIVVHSTATPQPKADAYISQWDKAGIYAAVHAFIESGRVVQTLPWNVQGAHAGGLANQTHIGFEICEPAGHTYVNNVMTGYDVYKNAPYFKAVWYNAVELCVMLCRKYSLPASSIVCHSEGYKLGIASNHGDVMHWFPRHGKNMDDFRKEVNDYLNEGTDNTPDDYAAKAVQAALVKCAIKGNENGDLMLHSPVTRQDMLVVLERLGLL